MNDKQEVFERWTKPILDTLYLYFKWSCGALPTAAPFDFVTHREDARTNAGIVRLCPPGLTKGRREHGRRDQWRPGSRTGRSVPLWPSTSAAVSDYMREAGIAGDDYLFPGRNVGHLTRSGARSRLDAAFARASRESPALARKRCTPHTLRHSCAMAMLAAGVDLSTIAIWLGHESVSTTHKYMVADMEMKERALELAAGSNPFGEAPQGGRYVPDPGILAFLDSL
ncbi:MAG: tyrosine-type recombinase/integrase [Coriobacteriales bacterium]|nr:tyrosine-type recombinase/integrase [Coriobacteriales bacterium]